MLSIEEYEQVRAHSSWFVLVAVHEDAEASHEPGASARGCPEQLRVVASIVVEVELKEVGLARWNWGRLAAGCGILFVALFVVAYVIPGKPPTMSAGNAKWVHYALSNSREIKVDSILLGLALITFVWFADSLAARLRAGGEPRLAAIAFGGAVASAAVFAIGIAVQAAVAYRIASEQPTLVKSFVELGTVALTIIRFPVVMTIGATAIAALRTGLFRSPRALLPAGKGEGRPAAGPPLLGSTA
jgi:hypothetical protein